MSYPTEIINMKLAEKIMNNADLKKDKLCTTLNKVYCEGKECENVYEIVASKQIGEKSVYGKIYQACLDKDCDFIAKWQKNKDEALQESKIQKIVSEYKLAPKIRQIFECKEGIIIIMDALQLTLARFLKTLTKEQTNITLSTYKNLYKNIMDKHKIDINIDIDNDVKNLEDLYKCRSKINVHLYRKDLETLEGPKVLIEDTETEMIFKKGVINQVFRLVQKLHEIGITHNDAHLNNFMCDSSFKFYIIDFGMSRNLDPNSDLDKETDFKRILRDLKKFVEEDGYINLEYLLTYYKNLM